MFALVLAVTIIVTLGVALTTVVAWYRRRVLKGRENPRFWRPVAVTAVGLLPSGVGVGLIDHRAVTAGYVLGIVVLAGLLGVVAWLGRAPRAAKTT